MLREQSGNLWDVHTSGEIIAITTNGIVKANGHAVMGAGLAKQAAERYPDLPRWLGQRIRQDGNHPYFFPAIRLVSFPTKFDWKQPADVHLIQDSLRLIRDLMEQAHLPRLFCPRPGCGLGQLDWQTVKHMIEPLVDDRFIFMTPLRESLSTAPTLPTHSS